MDTIQLSALFNEKIRNEKDEQMNWLMSSKIVLGIKIVEARKHVSLNYYSDRKIEHFHF